MKLTVRTGIAAAVAVGALAVAVAPASAAVGGGDARAAAGAHAVVPNPKSIKPAAYNQARSILANAGSQTAAKSHPIHGKDDVPVGYGTSLLAASRDEFRHTDRKLPAKQKKSGMSIPHYNAIHSAAKVMGIDRW
ncbi:hypothetical protein [Streptomyces griseocarneus]|uniref:hypothetical protein n=1 Tax=Streptomyces griseocarneus TaxID=51201 RepID=UPI0019A87C7A|nr:hypothetical protein [Streptomyces griseocarneus]MBZ6477192.1 hypothetical protein [Streptomyces griseocarneus]GHG53994.1 hypothetical protein GCM10018779_16540 [Streptomyces griseocarneus]